MHEQSLVRSLLKQVEELRGKHDGLPVSEVRVEMGPLSGVEPLLLVNAFDLLTTGSASEGATLVIDEVPLMAQCKSCNREFTIVDFVFHCPTCDGNVKVTSGDEIHLTSVSFIEESYPSNLHRSVKKIEQESMKKTETGSLENPSVSSVFSCSKSDRNAI